MILLMLYLKLNFKVSYSELHSKQWLCCYSMLYHYVTHYLQGKRTAKAFCHLEFSCLSKELSELRDYL